MNNKDPKVEYEVVSHGESDDNNRLVMICEKSEPEDLLSVENSEDVSYEIHNGEEIFHLVQQQPTTTISLKRPSPPLITSTSNNNNDSADSNNCQYFVINEYDSVAKRPCLILPKPEFPINFDTQQQQTIQPKKRDDKRRATHNEVERRRRDKINQWIFKLKELLPEGSTTDKNLSTSKSSQNDLKTNNLNKICDYTGAGKATQNDSKSAILIKACEYVKDMQEELTSLKKCLNNSESLHRENSMLKSENELLRNEIEQLKTCISGGQKQICKSTVDSINFERT